jgi:hypothetical protein
MSDGALHLLALVVATAGMSGLALANSVHWRQVLGARPQTAIARVACQASGAALLCTSFALCALADPLSMALLVWPMLLGVAGAGVAAVLTVKARGSTTRPQRMKLNPGPPAS